VKKIIVLSFGLFVCITTAVQATQENTYGPTQAGEMLWRIAGKLYPDDAVSRHQAMLALHKANPQAFGISCNLNSLKVGQTLRVPTLSEVQAITHAQALKAYKQQETDWQNRHQTPIVCPAVVEEAAAEKSSPTTSDSPSPAKQEKTADLKVAETTPEEATAPKAVAQPSATEAPVTATTPSPPPAETSMLEKVADDKVQATETAQAPTPPSVPATEANPPPANEAATVEATLADETKTVEIPSETTPSQPATNSPVEASEPALTPTPSTDTATEDQTPLKQPVQTAVTPSPTEASAPIQQNAPQPVMGDDNELLPYDSPFVIIGLTASTVLAFLILGWLLYKNRKLGKEDIAEDTDAMPLRALTKEGAKEETV
jgi:pilus assembly protein FimV